MLFSMNMAAANRVALVLFLAAALQGIHGLNFVVTNPAEGTDGGRRFDTEIGRAEAAKIMDAASQFIWQTFAQPSPADRRNADITISLSVENITGVAYSSNDHIHLNANYVASYQGDGLKKQITYVLYHEVTHSLQWNANGAAPSQLMDGIADYIGLVAGLAPSYWVKPGGGDRWDQGYDVTAYFLQYCDTVTSGFVAKLNSKLRDGWNVGFFNDLTGKSVDQLWNDYKAKYANSP